MESGGANQSRTGLTGFAIRGITALLSRQILTCENGKRLLPILDWSGKTGSNRRPIPWQGIALPTELFPHILKKPSISPGSRRPPKRPTEKLERENGFEPSTY